jgi:predicted CopG family antitoxin
MAVKTITIDMEAYEILLKAKKGKESFSKVIKKTFLPQRKTARNLLENLDTILLSDETLDAVDKMVKERSSSMTQSVILSENDE